MKYLLVKWKHTNPREADEPILLYSEIDDARWERRKVYIFRDGPPGYASMTKAKRGVMLGFEPVPSLHKIAKDPVFEPVEITREDFEKVWEFAISDPVDSRDLWQSFLALLVNL
jgi:hypothetical protein